MGGDDNQSDALPTPPHPPQWNYFFKAVLKMTGLALHTHSSSLCKMLANQKETRIATSLYYTRAGLPPPLDHHFL